MLILLLLKLSIIEAAEYEVVESVVEAVDHNVEIVDCC